MSQSVGESVVRVLEFVILFTFIVLITIMGGLIVTVVKLCKRLWIPTVILYAIYAEQHDDYTLILWWGGSENVVGSWMLTFDFLRQKFLLDAVHLVVNYKSWVIGILAGWGLLSLILYIGDNWDDYDVSLSGMYCGLCSYIFPYSPYLKRIIRSINEQSDGREVDKEAS